MTLDEAIKQIEEIVEENQKLVDTHHVSDELTIDEIYCDDTEIIEERLTVHQKRADDFRQLAEWLRELKQLREHTSWIPVSERMPNFNDIVLASADTDYEELRVILTVYEAEEYWFNGKIKAWMPSPKPYKEK